MPGFAGFLGPQNATPAAPVNNLQSVAAPQPSNPIAAMAPQLQASLQSNMQRAFPIGQQAFSRFNPLMGKLFNRGGDFGGDSGGGTAF